MAAGVWLRFDRVASLDGLGHMELGKQTQVQLVVAWAERKGLGRDLGGKITTRARADQFLQLGTKQPPWVSVIMLKAESRWVSPAGVPGF